MTDDLEAVAPSEATPEVLQPETGQEDQPEGQQEPPASDTEEKSEAQKRRERRRAQEQRQQEEFAAAQRKAQEAEARLERIKASVTGAEPKESDFSDIIEYAAAKGAWNLTRQSSQFQVAEIAAEAEQAKALAESTRAAHEQARQAIFQQAEADARKRYPDYDAVTRNPALFITKELVGLIQQSDEDSAEIVYYLGKNPQEAARLSMLPPTAAARELGRLESKLTAAPAKIASSAPPPINPVRAAGVAVKDIEKMSLDEFRAFKEKGGFKR